MKSKLILSILAMVIAGGLSTASASEHPSKTAPTADQQVQSLEEMCEASAGDRASRQAETTLYERLGKEKGINALTIEIMRLHHINPAIKHLVEGFDDKVVAGHVADFMVSGLGGPNIYTNRPSLPDSHRDMHLTNADFMAAGGDVILAMKNLGHGQNEIDEMVCTLVALRPMVVLADAMPTEHPH